MFDVRNFRLFCLALCVLLHWGQAYEVNAAAQVKSGKAKTGQSASRAPKAQSAAKAKPAAKPAAASQKSKPDASPAAKSKKREPLPPASPDLPQSGLASWVGSYFEGRPVAYPGERHEMDSFTAAHRAIPFNSILKVTDLQTGRSVLVRVNDRGPYVSGRIIDLAKTAADYLGYVNKGVTEVRLELAGNDKAPDQRYYVRMRSSKDSDKDGLMQGFGPFDKFDEAAALLASLYKHYPEAELVAVREKS
ncbi:MAG: septal ring lytic transglycosylase RlpA family protein [Deltaproteobacteria bacterium]|jgi:rare lipoprotein A (peptidoglycan hydrolase)|nr:septal ring lytic transglycosylase RlpA family protein [Deltaproteobacteria bacterium]